MNEVYVNERFKIQTNNTLRNRNRESQWALMISMSCVITLLIDRYKEGIEKIAKSK